jgi:hypothetical protein
MLFPLVRSHELRPAFDLSLGDSRRVRSTCDQLSGLRSPPGAVSLPSGSSR